LAYCNGVFHHIPPAGRDAAARDVFRWLRPGGAFALWENNPWNPGTRLVMSRIPFDRDAITLSYLEAQALLRRAGFRAVATSFHFFFPSALRALRRAEPWLERVPFGAQYCVLARKPA
jgi:SAM-dependent methyltransferase